MTDIDPSSVVAISPVYVATGRSHSDRILGQLALVDGWGRVLYNSHIRPPPGTAVQSCLTAITGITQADLKIDDATHVSFPTAQTQLQQILNGSIILVGRHIEFFVDFLRLTKGEHYDRLIDTDRFFCYEDPVFQSRSYFAVWHLADVAGITLETSSQPVISAVDEATMIAALHAKFMKASPTELLALKKAALRVPRRSTRVEQLKYQYDNVCLSPSHSVCRCSTSEEHPVTPTVALENPFLATLLGASKASKREILRSVRVFASGTEQHTRRGRSAHSSKGAAAPAPTWHAASSAAPSRPPFYKARPAVPSSAADTVLLPPPARAAIVVPMGAGAARVDSQLGRPVAPPSGRSTSPAAARERRAAASPVRTAATAASPGGEFARSTSAPTFQPAQPSSESQAADFSRQLQTGGAEIQLPAMSATRPSAMLGLSESPHQLLYMSAPPQPQWPQHLPSPPPPPFPPGTTIQHPGQPPMMHHQLLPDGTTLVSFPHQHQLHAAAGSQPSYPQHFHHAGPPPPPPPGLVMQYPTHYTVHYPTAQGPPPPPPPQPMWMPSMLPPLFAAPPPQAALAPPHPSHMGGYTTTVHHPGAAPPMMMQPAASTYYYVSALPPGVAPAAPGPYDAPYAPAGYTTVLAAHPHGGGDGSGPPPGSMAGGILPQPPSFHQQQATSSPPQQQHQFQQATTSVRIGGPAGGDRGSGGSGGRGSTTRSPHRGTSARRGSQGNTGGALQEE